MVQRPGFFRRAFPVYAILIAFFSPINSGFGANWTRLTNLAPSSIQLTVQMTDGTLLSQSYDGQTWMKLTPDTTGSYVNGTWSIVAPGLVKRIYFASQVLSDGRFWVAGGEYTGPALQANWGNRGEIYDPVANTWTAIAPFPPQSGCPGLNSVTGNLTSGSAIITNVYPQTTGIQAGSTVSGVGIPAGAKIVSTTSTTITISTAATLNEVNESISFNTFYQLTACLGDVPSQLLPGGRILVGDLINNNTSIYSVASDSWTPTGSKVYTNDSSDEEGWAKLPDGRVLNYDLFKSIPSGQYAEIYNPAAGTWSGISPSDGTALGTIPQLSSPNEGDELGPVMRLQDGRVLIIGATQHTALYDPSTNTWSAGPDTSGTLTNSQGTIVAPFGADDAPAAILPDGHVIFAADAGPARVTTTGNLTSGSVIVTGLPSTIGLQTGWPISGAGISPSTSVRTVDSSSQVTMTQPAISTISGAALTIGGTFSHPTQIFDFDPSSNTSVPLAAGTPGTNLPLEGAYPSRMLTLPTGQVLLTDSTSQAWIYTPDGRANAALRPAISGFTYNGAGVFTLTGKQLNGQSAGAAYGDDDQMDTNYPIVRFTATDGSNRVFYARTTNWSSVAVGGGLSANQTVNVTLNPALTAPGAYAMTVTGAGISSLPVFVNITQAEINKQ